MNDTTNNSLFHYTTGAGLKGILESKCLWATDYRFTNDGSELRYADDVLVQEFIKEMPKLFEPQENNEPPLRKDGFIKIANEVGSLLGFNDLEGACAWFARESFLKYHNKLFLECYDSFYLTSFCIHEDQDIYKDGLLSQWRGYAIDGGYAIEFDLEKLKVLGPSKHFIRSHVYYPTKNSHELISDCIARLKEGMSFVLQFQLDVNLGNDPEAMVSHYKSTPEKSDKIDKNGRDYALCKALIKHPGFYEEHEYRFIILSAAKSDKKPKVECREQDGKIIPYIKLFDGKGDDFLNTIKRIIVGPHPDKELRAAGVRSILNRLGMNDTEVTVSDIPYLGH